MRLFQNSAVPPSFLSRRRQGPPGVVTFKAQVARFLDNRYGALHFLAPVLNGDDRAFFTNGDDEGLQRTWAREMGMSTKVGLVDILLAQIESHRTEVFYNLDPIRYGSDFVRKLPGCVRKAFAWRNIPSATADFSKYDLVVCNSGTLLRRYEAHGWKAAYFSPAHDPVMDEFAGNEDRPIDVLFVGGYSRHHMRRAAVLEAVARLRDRYRIEFCLARSRATRLAESPLGYLAPVGKYRRPRNIRAVSREPVYGRDLYALISKARIVLNGTIDMSGEDRGNMRCFEAMGCRALMVSDSGRYPDGMESGVTMKTYDNSTDAVSIIKGSLDDYEHAYHIATNAYNMTRNLYSKAAQWAEFQKLVSAA
jgi:hypothetical protein